MKTGLILHPEMIDHDTGNGHPESPQRLSVLQSRFLSPSGMDKREDQGPPLEIIQPEVRADLYDWVSKVHSSSYIESLKKGLPNSGRVYLDPDTPYGPRSLNAAELAVSGVLKAIDSVMGGIVQNAFCAIRPPGHHAEKDHAMGFCLYNNIAIGAKYIQLKYRLKRVFIIDWDVHHGNGTQHTFYNDPSVFYFSTHQYPCYPGTGKEGERGVGKGEGFTLNCPVPAGSGDVLLLSKFEKELTDAVLKFEPDFILISAGFDAHRDDPLASLDVTESGFEEMTKIVASLAASQCNGRIVSSLEGGYNLEALCRSVERHLSALKNVPLHTEAS